MLAWEIYETIEPFGEFGDWMRAATIACVIANVHRSKKQKPFTPAAFMPKFTDEAAAPKSGTDSRRLKGLMLAMQKAQKEKMARAKAKEEAREQRRQRRQKKNG